MNVPFAYRRPAYLILLGLFETVVTSGELSHPLGMTAEDQAWLERFRRNLYQGLVHPAHWKRWEDGNSKKIRP